MILIACKLHLVDTRDIIRFMYIDVYYAFHRKCQDLKENVRIFKTVRIQKCVIKTTST